MRPGRLHVTDQQAHAPMGGNPTPSRSRMTPLPVHGEGQARNKPGKDGVPRNLRPSRLATLALRCMLVLALAALSGAPALATPGYAQAEVIIHGHTIHVDLADTEAKQELGLGNRAHLAPNAGMLFPYANEGHPAFWMKRMRFPIDMIWLDNDTVVHIAADVPPPAPGTPDSELPVYRPKALANFVLELAAGRARALSLHVGDQVTYRFDVR